MVERVFVSSWNETTESIEPLYNISVGSSEVIVTVDLPYVNPEEVTLKLPADDVVEIYANTKHRITFADMGVRHRGARRTVVPYALNPSDGAGKARLEETLEGLEHGFRCKLLHFAARRCQRFVRSSPRRPDYGVGTPKQHHRSQSERRGHVRRTTVIPHNRS
jgi:hypothetical protein